MVPFLFADAAWVFGVPALAGTLFVLLRTLGGMGEGMDLDHGDGGEVFTVLSLQSIATFLMGFGWGGIGAYRGWGWHVLPSAAVGLLLGGVFVWVLRRVLRLVVQAQVSGTIDPSAALYEEATVYVRVPEAGRGRGEVRVIVDDHLRYYPAVSSGRALETGTVVRVTAVTADGLLTVEPPPAALTPHGDA